MKLGILSNYSVSQSIVPFLYLNLMKISNLIDRFLNSIK